MDYYLLLILIMGTGFITGLFLRERQAVIRQVERLSRPVILLLLFTMGLAIGLDDQTMNNLLNIGLSSLGFAVCSVLGSLLLLALVLPVAGRGFVKRSDEVKAE